MHNRFYCPKENISNNLITIFDTRKIHRIVDVLRFRVGDKLVIFDGTGKDFEGAIKKLEKKWLKLLLREKRK